MNQTMNIIDAPNTNTTNNNSRISVSETVTTNKRLSSGISFNDLITRGFKDIQLPFHSYNY